MTPVPLDLPLRPPEAAEIANLVFTLAEKKPLTDEIRNRIAARAAALKLQSITPYFGSLARDPVHHSTYYLAVDTTDGPPLLLHMAAASAPTSSIFGKPLLIGRMRAAGSVEIVVNAIPFGAGDSESIDRFVAHIDGAFLPRPQSGDIVVASGDPAAAFEEFRAIQKRTGKNVAGLHAPYHHAVWAAIRAGWRQPYTVEIQLQADDAGREAIRQCPRYSRFMIAGTPAEVARFAPLIRQARAAVKAPPAFELGIVLPDDTTPKSLATALQQLKDTDYPAQVAAVNPALVDLPAFAAVGRQFNCILSVAGSLDRISELRGLSVHVKIP